MARETTAALVVIGNEILSGKVVDTNSAFLARELRALGVSLRRILVVPDEIEMIAEAVRALAPTVDVLFTSGGVGPTHDDMTISGVARALARPVVRHPAIEQMLRVHFGDQLNAAHLRLAEVVEGTELEYASGMRFPTFHVENIYVLPGIPELFQEKVLALRERFAGDPFHLRVVYLRAMESAIAAELMQTLDRFPELQLGSYPTLSAPDYHVRITLESKDPAYVEAALAELLRLLPADVVVRTE